jgi:zinc/manganese transport system permease protein
MQIWQVMLWPLLASLLLPWVLVYYGLHIVRRQIIFVDLALAQVAALGGCLAILLGYDAHDWQSYACSLAFTLVGAAIFTLTRARTHVVAQEALIGIVYVVAAAGAILMLSQSAGGNEELRRSLVGEILVVSPTEVLRTFLLYVGVGVVHYVFRRQFQIITYDPPSAVAQGIPVARWDFLFYALFGLVVTTYVHLAGVLLVFSYLITPVVCASLLADDPRRRAGLGWLFATLGSVMGLYASYRFDLPTGAAIVCALGALLLVIFPFARLRQRA